MTTLPDDIVLYNILPWRPSKTLLRFRCVCKSWDSFIRHPSFLHLRTLNNNPTHHFLCLSPQPHAPHSDVYGAPHPNTTIATTPLCPSLLFTLPKDYSITRVQCVNGLLCFDPRNNLLFGYGDDIFTLIANPTTRQVLTLPLDPSLLPLRTNSSFSVFNHFGYDPVRDEFKVLRFVNYPGSHEIKVFTLGGDTSWRRVVTPERPLSLMRPNLLFFSVNKKIGICVNGTLYWTCHNKINMHVNGAIHWTYSTGLLIFDLGTEQFREMPAPSGYSYKEENTRYWKYPDLVEIDGCLCLVEYSGFDLKLWILRDCEAQVWEQKSVVLPSGVVSPQQVVFPLCRVPTGEILLLPHFVGGCVRGVYYDMDTKSSRSVVVMELPHVARPWPDFRSGEVDIVFCQESFRLLK